MLSVATPRFILSGSRSGVGKTLLGIGLAHELRRRGVSVSCGIVGSNLVQAIVYRRISGRYVRCFDANILSSSQMLIAASTSSLGADLLMIQGNGGLYDSAHPGSLFASDAEIASLTKTPAVVVVDSRGFGASIAPVVKGLLESARGFRVAGSILNRADEVKKTGEIFSAAFDMFNVTPPLGIVPEFALESDPPVLRISQDKSTSSLPFQLFIELGNAIRNNVDLDVLIELGQSAEKVETEESFPPPSGRRAKIALSDDSCFSLCFQDNLDLMRYFGAEIVSFSPLADSNLPKDIGGIYFTGAYLSEYGEELAANESIKQKIKEFARAGGVIYSEGAGTAYLCREFSGPNGNLPGVGLINGSAVYSPARLSYTEAVTMEESIYGRAGLIFKGINTHEWRIIESEPNIKVVRFAKGGSEKSSYEGYSPGAQMLGTLSFPHLGSNPAIAKNIIDAAEVVRKLG